MYYLIYFPLYLLSLLPWRLLYWMSDGLAAITYHLIGYRKEVVHNNLRIAFPEKTEKERTAIAKEFYRNLIDTFIETIKLLSLSDAAFARRYSTNNELVNALYDSGKNVQIHAGHFFNLEVVNLGESRYGKYPFVVVYMPISNKAFDRIIYKLRSRYGAILIPAVDFKTSFHQYVRGRYALALAADQNPGNPMAAQWVKFFGRYTPFVTGPEKGAKRNDTAVVFANFYKLKRGYYHMQYELLTTNPKEFAPGKLTELFVSKIEEAIRQRPANYLWSHRRWKWEYNEEKHRHLVK
ncbi:MAG: lysophospholipid acyltransferase family protein [Chitinophagaceae bacterium]|nr:lysophospholipid acyltransferase family protein [Chitinophagaceae bacterium]